MSRIHHNSRIVLKGRYGVPSTPPALVEVLADSEWAAARARGGTYGLRRYSLGELDADNIDKKNRQRRAIGPDFTAIFNDSKRNDWTPKVTPEMQAEIDLSLAGAQADKAAIVKDIGTNTPTAAQAQSLADINAQIDEFSTGSAYLEEIPDAFGDGSVALYHSLGSAGTPSHYISNKNIDKDACHSLRAFFWKPIGNAKWEFSYSWSWWRLVISNNDVTLIRFNETLSQSKRNSLEAQITTLMDRGRLTAVDQKYINEQRAAIAQVKTNAKAAERDDKELTNNEKQDIQTAENNIKARQDAKRGLTPLQEDSLDKLKTQLYRDTATANLYSGGKDWFDKPLTLTLIPDRRGYLIICLGDQVWSYTDSTLRKTGYRGTMWDASKPEVRCSGGPYVWQPGAPAFRKKTTLALEPRRFGFDPTNVYFTIVGDWDANDGPANVTFPSSIVSDTGNADIPPQIQFNIQFVSDGKTPALLHQCTYFRPAGARDGSDDVYFDSDDHLEDGVALIEDIELSYNEERDSLTYEVTLLDTDGVLGADDANGRTAEVWIEDVVDGELQMVQMETLGIVKNSTPQNLAVPTGATEAAIKRANSRIKLVIGEQWDLMDSDIIHDQVPVDGMRQGQALNLALAGRGVKASERAGIDDGTGIVLGKASKTVNGKTLIPLRDVPLWKPSDNTQRGGWLRRVADVDAGNHLHIVSGVWTFDPPSTTPVMIFSGLDFDSRAQILDQLSLPDDSSETFNVFTVLGKKDEKTGKPIKMTRVVYESLYDTTDPRYLGYEKWYQVESDEALEDEEMVMNRLDVLERDHCKPTKMISIMTFAHTILRPKCYIMTRGLKYQIKTPASFSIARDRMAFTARLALDQD